MLGTIDWAVIVVYVLAVFYIAWKVSRHEGAEDFLIGNRDISTSALNATISASLAGGGALAAYIGLVYLYGISAFWLFIGVAIAIVTFIYFAKRVKAAADIKKHYTMFDYLADAWGKTNVIIAAFILLIAFLAIVIVEMILSGKIVALVTGLPYALSVIIAALIVFFYVFTGGFKSDVRTDFFQYLMIFLMIVIALVILPGASIGKSDLDFFAAGPVVIISFLVIGLFSMLISADVWQRAYAARNQHVLKRGFIGAAISFLMIGAIMTLIGIAFKAQFPTVDPNNALIHGFSQLPAGLLGIGLVVLLSATMSTIDTSLFISALFIARDMVSRAQKQLPAQLVMRTRKMLVALALIAALIAITVDNLVYIMYNVFNFALVVAPAVLGTFFLKMKKRAIFASLLAGILAALVLIVTNQISAETTTIPFFVSAVVLVIAQKLMRA